MTPKEIFDENQKLVGWCFKKYIGEYSASDFEDIMQEGMLGLWEASQKYDESKEIKFSTFAVPYIFGYMKRYVRDKRNVIRIARSVYDKHDTELISNLRNVTSLDAEVSQDDGSSTRISDLIGDIPDEYEFITEDLIDNFLATIKDSKHRDIMEEYYYAYVWCKKLTHAEIVEKYKISQPQVSRIIKRYNKKFKEYIHNL